MKNGPKKKDTPSYAKKYWSLIHTGPELYTLNHIIDKKIIKVHYDMPTPGPKKYVN